MVDLKGSLGGIGLPAIIQLIGELHHTGSLQLSKGAISGVLGFDDGRLVSASCGGDEGLAGLSACVLDLADGDFRFLEGIAEGERKLDLRGTELQRLLVRIASGESLEAAEPAMLLAHADDSGEPDVCPRLGFADDPLRHYSRSTALHRCFASVAPSLVTAQEQRDLCLSGRYPTCPRFRNAARQRRTVPAASAATVAPAETGAPQVASVSPTDGSVSPPSLPPPSLTPPPLTPPPGAPAGDAPTTSNEPPPKLPSPPAGVAARLAAASQMRPASETPANGQPAPDWIGAAPKDSHDDNQEPHSRVSSKMLLIGESVVLALVAFAVVAVLFVPAINNRFLPTPSPVTSSQALERAIPTAVPASSPTAASIALPKPSAVATRAPTTSAAPRPTAAPMTSARTSISPGTPPTMDLRFASGMPQNWLQNAPYAAWSDGAYRLRARQAGRFVAVGVPLDEPLNDVMVTATFRKTGGPPGGGYGVIVRDQGPEPRDGVNQTFNAYVFETGDLGEFGVWRREADHWVDLVPWTRSTAVRPGGSPNELVVRAVGDRLLFTVNSVELASLRDETWSGGRIGVFLGGDYNEVALDHFAIQVPD